MQNDGLKLWISGIPTAGKTYLAQRLATETGGVHVHLDDERIEFEKDPALGKWVRLYRNKDENVYFRDVSPEKRWQDLVDQSEALWLHLLHKIHTFDAHDQPVIFESVNLLPHLAARDLAFPGIVILGNSKETVQSRLKENPRWGTTEDLQRLEADDFYDNQRKKYFAEAEHYGAKTFNTADEAYPYALQICTGSRV